ncbi:MAG: GLPGLI family protein [Bacteroidaceae bacterium]|nr:GLPGLI family protein [Bacteroidaceae bacterium]
MKHKLVFLFICANFILCASTFAQTVLDSVIWRVYYDSEYRDTEEDGQRKARHHLDIGNDVTCFYDWKQERKQVLSDSLLAHGGNPSEIIDIYKQNGVSGSCTSYIVYKEKKRKNLKYIEKILNSYEYEEPLPDFSWELVEGDTIIAGFHCQHARTEFRGRVWDCWYTLEIPINDGPWKLCGLPGLILAAYDAKGNFTFSCAGIERIVGECITSRYSGKAEKCTPQRLNEIKIIHARSSTESVFLAHGRRVRRYDANGKLMGDENKTAVLMEMY